MHVAPEAAPIRCRQAGGGRVAAGNVSARGGDVIHITPRALPYEEVTERDVVLDTGRLDRDRVVVPAPKMLIGIKQRAERLRDDRYRTGE